MTFADRLFVAAFAVVAATTAVAANVVDPTERTSMPEVCSERDVNCVIPDGPPRRVAHPDKATAPGSTIGGVTAAPATGSSSAGGSGTGSSTGSLTGGAGKGTGSRSGGFGGAAR